MDINNSNDRNINPAPSGGTVLVAMSGGVDSSVAALLLQEAGWECKGVTMRLFSNEVIGMSGKTCCSLRDVADAEAVARRMGIPFKAVDYQADFRAQVIERFIRVYEEGATPNPCIDCNRTMKFGKLLDLALDAGCDHIATGHYAQVFFDEQRGRWLLRKAADKTKDQSYVLYMLTQEQLSRLVLPLGGLTKAEIRQIAAAHGFVNAHKQESQDICFVPDGDYAAFMEQYTGCAYPEGDFLDIAGNIVGRHKGAVRYTTGQRKGLGLALGTPVYVQGKDMNANTVTVGPEESLFRRELTADDANWISIADLTEPMRVLAMPRYRKKAAPATLYPLPAPADTETGTPDGAGAPCSRVRVVFDEPQRAMTPGQAVVFYDIEDEDLVVGGATIKTIGK